MGAGASNGSTPIRQERTVVASPAPQAVVSPTAVSPSIAGQHGTNATPHHTAKKQLLHQRSCLDKDMPCRWGFEEYPGEWKDFDAAASERIEQSFVEGKTEATVVVKGRLHTVAFETMVEQLFHGSTRNVRRYVPLDATTPDGDEIPSSLIGSSVRRRSSAKLSVDPFALDSTLDQVTRSLLLYGDDATSMQPTLLSKITAHESAVFGTVFSLSGDKIVTGSKDGTCRYWELQTSYIIREFEEHPGSVLSCAMSRVNENVIATGCDDWEARIFSGGDSAPKHTLSGHEHKVYSVGFSNDGKHLVTVAMDGHLRQWDVATGAKMKAVHAHTSSIFSLQTGSQSSWLAITASDDALLIAHDLRLQNSVTHRFVGHEKTLWGCDIRYDEGQYLSCGMDSKVMTWDPRNPSAPLSTITSHRNPVHCVEYMPDGDTYLSSARDRTFKLTVAETGKEIFSCQAHDGNVYKVTYNAATEVAMTCGSDAAVKLWKLPRIME